MSVMIKICGLTAGAALEAALLSGADMVGFVFYEKSARHISLERAASLGRQTADRAQKVLLTVDAGDELLAAAVTALEPHLLQLHGSETPQRAAAVRARFGLPVIKAIGIRQAADLALVAEFESVADFLLFDAKPAPAGQPGGNGQSFDWRLLRALKTCKPWLLAGGLNAANAANAIAETGAPGVDVSSGVESAPGVKDAAKIEAFIAEVRRAAAELGQAAQSG